MSTRENRKAITLSNFSGGIDQRDMEAAPNTVRDARNVWWRNGRLEQRPGYLCEGLVSPLDYAPSGAANAATDTLKRLVNTPAGTTATSVRGTMALATAATLDDLDTAPTELILDTTYREQAIVGICSNTWNALYIGVAPPTDANGVNPNDIQAVGASAYGPTPIKHWQVQYWNGAHWVTVPHVAASAVDVGRPTMNHTSQHTMRGLMRGYDDDDYQENRFSFSIAAPSDWQTWWLPGYDPETDARYYIRVVWEGATHADHTLVYSAGAYDAEGAWISLRGLKRQVPWWLPLAPVPGYWCDAAVNPAFAGAAQFDTKSLVLGHPFVAVKQWAYGNGDSGSGSRVISGYGFTQDRIFQHTLPHLVQSTIQSMAWWRTADIWWRYQPFPVVDFRTKLPLPNDRDAMLAPATVSSDPDLVGTGAPYDVDVIAQLATWPDAEIIYYHDGQLFAFNFPGAPTLGRWSAPELDGALEVWPEVNLALFMDEQDSSGVTGCATLNEHLYVFKRNSIWMMVPNGSSDEGLAVYSVRKVVSGVGSVNHHSIAAGNGRLYFLSEGGACAFDGINVMQLTSDKFLDNTFQVVRAQERYAAGAWWAAEQCYLLSIATGGSTTNNLTLCYQPGANACWLWEVGAQNWTKATDSALGEVLYFHDAYGRLCQMGLQYHDHFDTIEAYFKTHKLGLGDYRRFTIRDLRMTASTDPGTYTLEVYGEDDDSPQDSTTINMVAASGREWEDDNWGTLVWDKARTIDRRVDLRESVRQFSLKVSAATFDKPLQVQSISIGVKPEGKR